MRTTAARMWLPAMAAILCLACGAPAGRAQSGAKPPAKSSARTSQMKDDPLAPLLRQATEAIDKQDFSAALDPLQKYIAERPDDAYAHFQLGYAYVGLKRTGDSQAEFSRAIALDPKMAAAHLNLGLTLMDTNPASAAESFQRAADLQPAESRPRFLEAYALERAGKLADAISNYRTALVISPKDYEIQFGLGRALLRSTDAAGAEPQFRGAIATRPDAAPAQLGLAHSLMAEKKYEAAAAAFSDYLKLRPDDNGARVDRAFALFDLDRFDDALAELGRSGASSSPDALKLRGEILMRQSKWKEAAEALTQAMKQSPKDPEPAFWLGHVDIQLHDYPAAISLLSQVYKQNPDSTDALRELANALFLHEDYAAALGAMDQLDKVEMPKPGSWFVRAICYDKLSRKPEAISAYQKFLDQDNGQHDTQDFQARHRIEFLKAELAHSNHK